MRHHLLVLGLAVASPAFAQVRVEVNFPVPTITFTAPPPMVVVQPGVQVVENYDEEVFFSDNYYWARRDGRWFRTRSHQGGWVVVEPRYVPRAIVVLPPGRYRHYRHEQEQEREHGRGPVIVVPEGGHGKHGKHHRD